MSLALAVLLSIAALGNSLALPQIAFPQPFASNTSISFYTGGGQGSTAGSTLGTVSHQSLSTIGGCGIRISESIIDTMYCTSLISSSISIGQTTNGSCTFTLFTDSSTCDVLGTGDAMGYNKHQIVIPNGQDETCIGTGVLDGGKFQKASGVWACG